jgi:hypothetical protein
MADIEDVFANTTKLIFGKSLYSLSNYEVWMVARLPHGQTVKSAFSDQTTYMPNYSLFSYVTPTRVVALSDTETASEKKIGLAQSAIATISLEEIVDRVKDVAYFVPDFAEGRNIDVTDTTVYLDSINLYKSFDIFSTKHTAYTFSCINSEGLFGCYRIASSKFCIHCYNCYNLTLCFEMDNAKNCSESMFCHNVENVHNSMFCFNTKNKRYAIANVEVGKEAYAQIRGIVVAEILRSLEATHNLKSDIYNALG